MKGFREPGRKERLRSLETELKNSQASLRISQMMTQQLMQNMRNMSQDLGKAFGIINELQYKVLAMQKAANLDLGTLNELASEMRRTDFEEASAKEDEEQKMTVGDVVTEDSTIIITSTTPGTDPDSGIFRSRVKLADCGVPDLISGLAGAKVGTKITVKLNSVDHEIELLGIRQPPVAEPVAQEPELKTVEPLALVE
jgi:hypothetical protein